MAIRKIIFRVRGFELVSIQTQVALGPYPVPVVFVGEYRKCSLLVITKEPPQTRKTNQVLRVDGLEIALPVSNVILICPSEGNLLVIVRLNTSLL